MHPSTTKNARFTTRVLAKFPRIQPLIDQNSAPVFL